MSGPLEIRTGRRPFEVVTMTAGVISAAAGIVTSKARSNAIEMAFPSWFIYVYYCSLLAWCGLTLAALVPRWPRSIQPERLRLRLTIERAGLYGMGYTCAAYGIAALSYAGFSALGPALFVGLFGVAAGARIREIHIDLAKLKIALATPEPADPPPLADPGSE